ncbi:MAG: hypothetical protein IKA76_05900 [Clostridia bacterium]|nr:hypothetical protein [Clostridia bacterium]
MNSIKFGWNEVTLIPAGKKVDLAGQFYERITDEARDPLSVTALAIECGDEQAIFCACDLVSTGYSLLCAVRERIAGKIDFPPEKLMISAIHTHTGPGYADRSDCIGSSLSVLQKLMPDVEYEELVTDNSGNVFRGKECFEFLADRVAEAAIGAWNNRRAGKYASGFGRAAVGMCRRVCYDDGSALMWGDTNTANFTALEGGNDSGIELMFLADENEKLTGVIANLACPAQVLEHRNFISADFWGDVKKRLRKEYGEDLFLLSLCSAAGDQCPRDMIRWVEPETPINDPNIIRENVTERIADPSMFDIAGCERIARRIATEIIWAYEEKTPYISEAPFKHSVMKIDMPLRRVTIAEKNASVAAIEKFRSELKDNVITFKDNARMHIYAGNIARYELQQTVDVTEIEVHVLRLGDISFATNPYELFLDYGNQIKARSRAKQTMLIQLSCGSFGYLPTEKAEKGSHYSAYVSSGMQGHEGGDLLVRKTVSEINKLLGE